MALLDTVISAATSGAIGGAVALMAYRLRAKQDMRIAVLEERFQAHQEAYEHMLLMGFKYIQDPHDIQQSLETVQGWWAKKNLYLDPEPRNAVAKCMSIVADYAREIEVDVEIQNERERNLISELDLLIDKLVAAVDLPPIKGGEKFFRL